MSLMATARGIRVCFCPASGRHRSVNTFPELRVMISRFFPFAISGLVIVCSGSKSSGDQFHVPLSRFSACGRFLLKGMQHVDCTLEPYRVDCTVSVASVIRDHFEDAGADSLPGLCVRMLTSKLRNAEGQADRILDSFRKIQKIVLGGPHPKQ